MSRYYDVVPSVNMYEKSKDYGRVFGFAIVKPNGGGTVKRYLFHDYKLVLSWPLRKRARQLVGRCVEKELALRAEERA
jgi:hypothetical protein